MTDPGIYRIIDANLNRVMEGLRVCEDVMRFASRNEALTAGLKGLRHEIFQAVKPLRNENFYKIVSSRDVDDIGVTSNDSEKTRADLIELFFANSQRGKESLRVLEEVLKLLDRDLSQRFKELRFKLYEIEKIAVDDLK